MALTVGRASLQSALSKCHWVQVLGTSGLLAMPRPFGMSSESRLRIRAGSKLSSEGMAEEADWSGWEQLSVDCSDRHLIGSNTNEIAAGGRRGVLMSMVLFGLSAAQMAKADDSPQDTAPLPLEVFSDAKDGFTMLRPAVWKKVDKPGATVFFEDPEIRANNIGVTVNPVRIASLKAFGTVDDVTEKLIHAERDKPSTKDMQVIRVQEKQLLKDTPLYTLEYTLDTSRGSKRVLTAVTVSAYKLYILSIVYVDGAKSPAPVDVDDALHKVLNSFELLA
ncbi:hypothetical protein Mapa_010632 [Marchantia paleacea]|nr:hypothetical protein Mapa_010632 [Marchantia paleacea]